MLEKDAHLIDSFLGQQKLRCLHREWAIHCRHAKRKKLRLLAICSRLQSTVGDAGYFCVIDSVTTKEKAAHKRQSFVLKKAFSLAKLVVVEPKTKDRLGVEFKGSEALTFLFESAVQRDIFVSTTKRVASDTVVQQATTETLDPLLAPVAREQKKHAILSSEEELKIIAAIESFGCSLSSMLRFDTQLRDKIHGLEYQGAESLVRGVDDWSQLETTTEDLTQHLDTMEEKLNQYASELMKRKVLIESIEHQNNAKRRSRDNVGKVFDTMTELRDRLTLSDKADLVISRLDQTTEDTQFHYVSQQLYALVDAINQVEVLLSNDAAAWESEQNPIPAVVERRELFTKYRLLICHEVKRYIFTICDKYRTDFALDRTRRSSEGVIYWQPPAKLFEQLMVCRPIVRSLKQCDNEGYAALLRHFCCSMQPVYAQEIRCFFREMRDIIKKTGWRGGFKIGQTAGTAFLEQLVEGGELQMTQVTASSTAAALPTPSPALSFRSNSTPARRGLGAPSPIRLVLPSLKMAGIQLLQDEPAAYIAGQFVERTGETTASKFFDRATSRVAGTDGGGFIRPDVAFAMVLSSVADIVLYQESLLLDTFSVDWSNKSTPGSYSPLDFCLTELFSSPDMFISFERKKKASVSFFDEDDEEEEAAAHSQNEPTNIEVSVTTPSTVEIEYLNFVDVACKDCDGCYLFSMISMTDAMLAALKPASFLEKIVLKGQEKLLQAFMAFVSDQSSSVHHSALKVIDTNTFLPFFANFPLLINRLESLQSSLRHWNGNRFEIFVAHLTQQMFAVLDELSYVTNTGLFSQEDIGRVDPAKVRKGYLPQYRHCAFFAVTAQSFSAETQRILAAKVAEAIIRRDRYEHLYLTRVILADGFPTLERFSTKAEDLTKAYQRSELIYHKAVSQEAFVVLFRGLEKEVRTGIGSAGRRMRRHLSVGVATNAFEEGFHARLVHLTWKHFLDILRSKLRLVITLPGELGYGQAVKSPVTLQMVDEIVSVAEESL